MKKAIIRTATLLMSIGIVISSCNSTPEEKQLDAQQIIQNSIKVYDPDNQWDTFSFKAYIQEPRIGNPKRFSELQMNNKDHSFELLRNRDSAVSKHIVDVQGKPITFLDNRIETDTTIIKKYRLQPERNFVYQKFYYHLFGLPMSLNDKTVAKYGNISRQKFNDKSCYKVEIVLKEEVFSKYWNIYIDEKDYKIHGIEMVFPNNDQKGERLYFEGNIETNGLKVRRTRHWHELSDDTYSGSDIIMNLDS